VVALPVPLQKARGRPALRAERRMSSEMEQNRRGLVKLMLKLPALRGRLQLLSVSNPGMFSLCGAFEEASATLERLRKERLQADRAVLQEYESLCEDIEREIVEMCGK
jgi:hypothetical protein